MLLVLLDYKKFKIKDFLCIKDISLVFLLFLIISYISVFFSIDRHESLKEVNSELLKNIVVMAIMFLYFKNIDQNKLKPYLNTIYLSVIFHTIINIFIWSSFGFSFEHRMGGLLDGALDNGGGERFGIWATYALAFAIAIYKENKKLMIFLLFLTLLSIVSTQTRAAYIGALLMLIAFVIFIVKSIKLKFAITAIMVVVIGVFSVYSSNLSSRYNLSHIDDYYKMLSDSPMQMQKYEQMGFNHSITSRLSMWKSAILYRLEEPFMPTGYGRFLYHKTIVKLVDKEKQPFCEYSQAHNEFVGILFSLGIFGFLLFLLIWVYFLKYSYALIKTNTKEINTFGIFTFLGAFGFIGSLCFGSFFADSEARFFYIIFGMVCAIFCNNKQDKIV
ncbi:O-antigen ligase family protein [Campylobacter gastrosuis]|uniref:O-antigen ligase family protein n=1 Tax=Campylobacter gastrosuis TaxID=2974576 RepID=A0ABT7HLB5_9BACT|nr:O-antigen ligase family protein [Campylobacter gastrosuis]MDL0087801.1 O-antigen ligase family protein [Campylobacter gastrosuis]MDL0088012.1 O-antigen ligase family protein [Campylobacter gastrosuis]